METFPEVEDAVPASGRYSERSKAMLLKALVMVSHVIRDPKNA